MTCVSVIVPAYNASETLSRTVKSISDQTHKDLEIFIVNDGSIDSTLDCARKLAADDQRIKVIDQANSGVAIARNTALAQATGTYVAWIDADDLWHPTKIAKQIALFEAAEQALGFVYTGYRLIDPDDRVIPNFRPLSDMTGHTLAQQIATNFISHASSLLVRREVAVEIGGHDPNLRALGFEGAEDLLLQLQLAAHGKTICCKEALVGYRMHSDNMSLGFARASKSNEWAINKIQETVDHLPNWVFRMGRARIVGYSAHLLKAGLVIDSFGLVARLMVSQPYETIIQLWMMLKFGIRTVFGVEKDNDPAIGLDFADADPNSVLWQRPMLLTPLQEARLKEADLSRLKHLQAKMGSF